MINMNLGFIYFQNELLISLTLVLGKNIFWYWNDRANYNAVISE